jgi:hypothetical protein
LISALVGGDGKLHAPTTLSPGKDPPVTIELETVWARELVWMTWRREKCLAYRDSNYDASVIKRDLLSQHSNRF